MRPLRLHSQPWGPQPRQIDLGNATYRWESPLHHLAGYLTVYLTVLLVSPFPGPTVAVTRFSGPQGRD
jgi:hypothetical protein